MEGLLKLLQNAEPLMWEDVPEEEWGKKPAEMAAYRPFDSQYHPGLSEDNLRHTVYDRLAADNRSYDKIYRKVLHYLEPSEQLCHNCGWTLKHEQYCQYVSRVKIGYFRRNGALWDIGDNWFLRDEPNNRTCHSDLDALEFLHSKSTTIPIPEIIRLSDPKEKFIFSLMTRAQGEPLIDVWRTYSVEQKRSVMTQLGGFIQQWRQFTAPRAQKVNGDRLDDKLIGRCWNTRGGCKEIGYTRDEWLENLTPELSRSLLIEDPTLKDDPERLENDLKALKESFPACEPYVFTHGDLNVGNIIVQDGKITGVIDWERSGFYPWWAEHLLNNCPRDEDLGIDYLDEYLCSGYSKSDWTEMIQGPVGKVTRLFQACPCTHYPNANKWYRRPFCRCTRHGQQIWEDDLAREPAHGIDEPEVEVCRQRQIERVKRRQEIAEREGQTEDPRRADGASNLLDGTDLFSVTNNLFQS